MAVSPLEIAGITLIGTAVGAGVKAGLDRYRKSVVDETDAPSKEIATTSQAADAIAKAAASLVEMLQEQLVLNAAHLTEVLAQLTIANEAMQVIKAADAECQRRLGIVEAQLEGLKENRGA